METLLEVKDLSVSYFTRRGEIKAVDGVSFDVRRGEVFGVAGESACGKSTIAMSILRLIRPPGRIKDGEIIFDGTNVLQMSQEELRHFRWKKVSMVFQGAMNSLNPVHRIGSQITEAILIHDDLSRREALKRAEELLTLVGIERSRLKDYPHQLSGGMRQRAVIAMALALNPKLLIADEPTTALDVVVQRQVLDLLMDMKRRFDLSLIFISHDISTMAGLSDRMAIMYAGRLMELADTKELFSSPLHPYTRGLIKSLTGFVHKGERLWSIPGSPPDLDAEIPGCSFEPRCQEGLDQCPSNRPGLVEVEPHHYIACNKVTC
ncbi:MAG: ABC transporter ATP-binding protein [Candidatus Bathyarchaeia archaeon]